MRNTGYAHHLGIAGHVPIMQEAAVLLSRIICAGFTRGCWACGSLRGRPSPLAAHGCKAGGSRSTS